MDLNPLVEARLVSLRQFQATCPPMLQGARLFRYRGPDLAAAVDVLLENLEAEVAACIADGFGVDWICRNDLLYLRVVEADALPPSWERVFAQQDMADVTAILRGAE